MKYEKMGSGRDETLKRFGMVRCIRNIWRCI